MSAFPEYTKRDVERACERGLPIRVDKVVAAQQKVNEYRDNPRPDYGISMQLAKVDLRNAKHWLATITQLTDRISTGEVCILTPSEFDAIKPWLPVARVKP